ncbi:hypothetical protein, partial [Kingella kingae]|uniref:hypothetical protein n=1 Tax=Kingella kingae TaxID=504 RepID=UPI0018AD5D1F
SSALSLANMAGGGFSPIGKIGGLVKLAIMPKISQQGFAQWGQNYCAGCSIKGCLAFVAWFAG